MANGNMDASVLGHIDGLVKEEEQLYGKQRLTDGDRGRLEKIKIELDQYWDLLRQRRALREFGRDPKQSTVRPTDVVEDYEQLAASISASDSFVSLLDRLRPFARKHTALFRYWLWRTVEKQRIGVSTNRTG